MRFLEVVQRAGAYVAEQGPVSLSALRREFGLDDDALDDLVEELTQVQGVAVRDGFMLRAVAAPAPAPPEVRAPGVGSTEAPDPHAARDTERRQLTILFCDLVGSTALSTQLDPEELSEAIRAYHDAVDRVVSCFGGHVAQHVGDGLLAYFGYPVAREDSAEQAVRAALEIGAAVAALGREFTVRVGLHTGLCVVSGVGAGVRREMLALGEAPNVAARILALGDPGTVLISSETERLVSGWFVVEAAGTHELKGVAEPMALYRVLQASPVRSRLEARRRGGLTALIGRSAERRQLRDHWESARTGSGRVVRVTGEAGIGKSRLVRELRDQIAETPHRWLETGCSLYMRNTAFWPIVELLEQAMGFVLDSDPAKRAERLDTGLGALGITARSSVAALASFLSLPHPSLDALDGLSPEACRERTVAAVSEWLLAASEREPLVVVVEDLHWADPSTLELLERIAPRMADARILLLVTYRPEGAPSWPDPPRAASVTLARMSEQQSRQLIRARIPRRALSDAAQLEIVERAEGIPLFLEELTQAAVELDASDRDAAGASPIPATLQGSLMARLDRLGAAKTVAQVAAVIGREFSSSVLRTLLEDQGGGVARGQDLEGALEKLVEAELIHPDSVRSGASYVFKHALLQEAAYESLLKKTRRELHAAIVRVLRGGDAERAGADAERIARHAEAAGMGPEAIELYREAAAQATARSAHEEALEQLRRAIAVLAGEAPGTERDRREAALQRHLALESIAARGYSHEETATAWERMRQLSESVGDARGQVAAMLGLSVFDVAGGRLERALPRIEAAVALAEASQDAVHRIAGYGERTQALFFAGRFRAAVESAQQAMALYDPDAHHAELVTVLGDDAGVAARATAGWALWHMGFPDRAVERTEEACKIALSLGNPFCIAQTRVWRTVVHMYRRDGLLEERARDLLEFCERQGFRFWSSTALGMIGLATADVEIVQRAATIAAQAGNQAGVPSLLWTVAEIHRHHGRRDEALAAVEAGLQLGSATGQPYNRSALMRMKGEVLLIDADPSDGEPAREAGACFRQAIEIARGQGARSQELRAALRLSQLLSTAGRSDRARRVLEPVYEGFDEGFDCADLVEAREHLAALGR